MFWRLVKEASTISFLAQTPGQTYVGSTPQLSRHGSQVIVDPKINLGSLSCPKQYVATILSIYDSCANVFWQIDLLLARKIIASLFLSFFSLVPLIGLSLIFSFLFFIGKMIFLLIRLKGRHKQQMGTCLSTSWPKCPKRDRRNGSRFLN